MRRRLKKPAQLLAYMHLFELAGHRPGSLRFSKQQLAAEFGCEPRTADGWIDGLKKVGLLEIIFDDKGMIDAYLHSPEAVDQPGKIAADPQRELGLADHAAGGCAQSPPGVYARKPPIVPEARGSQSIVPSTIRIADCYSETGVSAQEPPNSPMDTIEPNYSMGDGLQKSSLSMDSMEGESALADLEWRRQQEADRIDRQAPRPIAGAMVEAVNRLADNTRPEKVKEDLIDLIMSRRYPNLDRVIAARAAEAVVFDKLPRKEISRILDSVDRSWKAGKIHTPGAVFQKRMREACDAAGIKWRDGKSARSDGEGER